MTPGGLYLLGLVKHLAAAEYYWLCEIFGRPAEPASLAATDDAQLDPGDTTESVLGYYSRARQQFRAFSRFYSGEIECSDDCWEQLANRVRWEVGAATAD